MPDHRSPGGPPDDQVAARATDDEEPLGEATPAAEPRHATDDEGHRADQQAEIDAPLARGGEELDDVIVKLFGW